ncbi:MAG: hypothetical protein J6C49_03405 [Elusimicrobiaceae bacterium]|nr:hypothetical protein [Elusimicrobiaceae bacterium]
MKKILFLALLLGMGPGGAFAQTAPAEKVTAVYFGSPYCGHCQHLEREFLAGFIERNRGKMDLIKVDVTQDNLAFMEALKEYGAEFPGTPAMAIGDEFLMGYPQEIGERADLAVAKAVKNGEKTRVKILSGTEQAPAQKTVTKTSATRRTVSKKAAETPDEAALDKPVAEQPVLSSIAAEAEGISAHKSVFKRLTFWMIAGAGLIDGINPCAFAVIVFFISFLSVYKYTRREMIVVGTSYCVAVFLAYVLLGLGAFKFLYALQGFYYVMWAVKAGTVLLCVVFLALSVYDFVHYARTKDASGLVLQLPANYKTFIHKVMHAFLKDRQKSVWRLGAAAAAVGFIVSLVEAVCTGQVYLPTIVVVLKEAGEHFWRAAGYLLFYNLMFIVPLAAVFLLALAGCESKTFGGWLKKHLGLTKILMCLVFLALLAVLIKTW